MRLFWFFILVGSVVRSWAAAFMKIDTCPLEGIDPERYDEILDLKRSGYRTLAGCALGYRSLADEHATVRKARFPRTQVIEYV